MRVFLEVRTGSSAGKKIPLKTGESVRIGRTPKSDFVVSQDTMMSGAHFIVECEEKGCRIRDLKSSNGTLVNRIKITTAWLNDGDEIVAGTTRFRVHFEKESVEALPPLGAPAPVAPPVAPSPSSVRPQPPSAPAGPGRLPPLGAPTSPTQPPKPAAPAPLGPLPPLGAPKAPLSPIAPLPLPTPPPSRPAELRSAALPSAPEATLLEGKTPQDRLLRVLRKEFQPLYALLDAANEPDVFKFLVESKEEYESLFEGARAKTLAHFAPYLVRVPPKSPLLKLLVEKGWGKGWGLYLTCDRPLKEVRTHFRQFLMANLPDGRQVYFRFYDPRVLRLYLPTCLPEESSQFFGLVKYFAMEDENREILLRFSNTGKGVGAKQLRLAPEAANGEAQMKPAAESPQPLQAR